MAKRKTITKKTRFEVFKRDSFKCQYCGASAPEAVLVVDHIHPVSKGGENELVNYITSCQPCNAGKGDRTLADGSAVQKQKAQLDELNDRREQLEMMLQWRDGLKAIGNSQVEIVHDAWRETVPGFQLSEHGLKRIKALLKKYGLEAVLDALDVVRDQYVVLGEDGDATKESADLAGEKLEGVLHFKSMPHEERQIHYIKGILRNRLSYVPFDVVRTLRAAYDSGVSLEDLKLEAKNATSWSRFKVWLDGQTGEGMNG